MLRKLRKIFYILFILYFFVLFSFPYVKKELPKPQDYSILFQNSSDSLNTSRCINAKVDFSLKKISIIAVDKICNKKLNKNEYKLRLCTTKSSNTKAKHTKIKKKLKPKKKFSTQNKKSSPNTVEKSSASERPQCKDGSFCTSGQSTGPTDLIDATCEDGDYCVSDAQSSPASKQNVSGSSIDCPDGTSCFYAYCIDPIESSVASYSYCPDGTSCFYAYCIDPISTSKYNTLDCPDGASCFNTYCIDPIPAPSYNYLDCPDGSECKSGKSFGSVPDASDISSNDSPTNYCSYSDTGMCSPPDIGQTPIDGGSPSCPDGASCPPKKNLDRAKSTSSISIPSDLSCIDYESGGICATNPYIAQTPYTPEESEVPSSRNRGNSNSGSSIKKSSLYFLFHVSPIVITINPVKPLFSYFPDLEPIILFLVPEKSASNQAVFKFNEPAYEYHYYSYYYYVPSIYLMKQSPELMGGVSIVKNKLDSSGKINIKTERGKLVCNTNITRGTLIIKCNRGIKLVKVSEFGSKKNYKIKNSEYSRGVKTFLGNTSFYNSLKYSYQAPELNNFFFISNKKVCNNANGRGVICTSLELKARAPLTPIIDHSLDKYFNFYWSLPKPQ